MEIQDSFVHPLFSISGKSYSKETLLEYAHDLSASEASWQAGIGQFFIDWLDNSSSIEIKTSGTTNGVKTLRVNKSDLMAHAQMSCDFFDLKPQDKIAHVLSNDFIAAKMILVRALTRGLDLWCFKPSKSPLDGVSEHFDWVSMVPLQLAHSLPALSQIKNLLIGGAPMSEDLRNKSIVAATEHQCQIFISFGMTETLSHIAVAALKENSSPLFKTLPGISISVDSKSCLQIQADYLKGVITTSDVVELVGSHSFLWLGRSDYTVNSGGIKLQPELIEREFSASFKELFFFCGIPDPMLGEKLCLVVLASHKEMAITQIHSFVFSSPYYRPKSVLTIPKFCLTNSEKIKRKESLSNGYDEHHLS